MARGSFSRYSTVFLRRTLARFVPFRLAAAGGEQNGGTGGSGCGGCDFCRGWLLVAFLDTGDAKILADINGGTSIEIVGQDQFLQADPVSCRDDPGRIASAYRVEQASLLFFLKKRSGD